MAENPEAGGAMPLPMPPKLVGYIGLALSLAGCIACVALFFYGVARLEGRGHIVLYSLLFAPVAAVGVSMFRDFLQLPDWSVAPEVPLGLKLIGHLGRVLGTLAAMACIALALMTLVFPSKVPPLPTVKPGEAAREIQRPALAAIYVLGIFWFLLVRLVASGVAELRRWARSGALILTGSAVAVLTVSLIINYMGKNYEKWGTATANQPLWVLDAVFAVLFLFLLGYLMLAECIRAFEAHRL